ncbi:MAG: hypothetical protein HY904_24955 [Deltaproteobacteria bacterium]|nr:hypothetical protein [Deltaproteobacteria bacterium]
MQTPTAGRRRVAGCVALLFAAVVPLGCGPRDGDGGSTTDPAAACAELCTKDGYSSSRVDVQSNETNCFCSSGTGPVTDADCAAMCTSMGMGNPQAFGSTGPTKDSCQCS